MAYIICGMDIDRASEEISNGYYSLAQGKEFSFIRKEKALFWKARTFQQKQYQMSTGVPRNIQGSWLWLDVRAVLGEESECYAILARVQCRLRSKVAVCS